MRPVPAIMLGVFCPLTVINAILYYLNDSSLLAVRPAYRETYKLWRNVLWGLSISILATMMVVDLAVVLFWYPETS
jgi:hypothetical protein